MIATKINPGTYPVESPGRMIEVAMLQRKVRLKLTRDQFAVLGKMMTSYIRGAHLADLDDKAVFYIIWGLYEGKMRKKMLGLKPEIVLSLELSSAWALVQMLYSMELSGWPYELAVASNIISEINHQTV